MENNNRQNMTNINWYPGHMAKTKRQIAEDLKLIDVVIELLDSRIPIASRNPDINQITSNKKRIIVLNKSDLVEKQDALKWISYFEKQKIPAVLTDSVSGKGMQEVILKVQECMKQSIEENRQKGRVGKPIRIMVLGIPNVGKSSFINRISKRNTAEVGNKPGVTKSKQWVKVGENIELLDTPGVLWPKFENQKVALHLAFTGTIKDEILEKTEVGFELLSYLLFHYLENVIQRYDLKKEEIISILNNSNQDKNTNIYEIMTLIGRKRGAVLSGGRIDDEKIAGILLEDFRSGRMGKIMLEKIGKEGEKNEV